MKNCLIILITNLIDWFDIFDNGGFLCAIIDTVDGNRWAVGAGRHWERVELFCSLINTVNVPRIVRCLVLTTP